MSLYFKLFFYLWILWVAHEFILFDFHYWLNYMNTILMHMNISCVENFLLHMKIFNHVGVYVKFPFYLRNFGCILVFFVQFLSFVNCMCDLLMCMKFICCALKYIVVGFFFKILLMKYLVANEFCFLNFHSSSKWCN